MSLISEPVFSKWLCVIVHLWNTYEVILQSALDLLSSCLPEKQKTAVLERLTCGSLGLLRNKSENLRAPIWFLQKRDYLQKLNKCQYL